MISAARAATIERVDLRWDPGLDGTVRSTSALMRPHPALAVTRSGL